MTALSIESELHDTKKELADLKELIQGMHCGLFATRNTVAEAYEYGKAIMKASSPQESEAMWTIATGVYVNTIAVQLGAEET